MTADQVQKHHDESESEGEDEEIEPTFPDIDVDIESLTPLSPQVIAKQVCIHPS